MEFYVLFCCGVTGVEIKLFLQPREELSGLERCDLCRAPSLVTTPKGACYEVDQTAFAVTKSIIKNTNGRD